MRVLAAVIILMTSGCIGVRDPLRQVGRTPLDTTFGKFLVRAEAGDAESQNVVGFMLFFGEGVPRNRLDAHRWFHRAATQGSVRAERNLAVMQDLGAGGPPDDAEAARHFRLAGSPDGAPRHGHLALAETVREAATASQSARPGEPIYVMFCAGCHGFNGIAEYEHSPSFALGERLDKSDAELLRSIERGIGEMPRWGDKLPRDDLAAVVTFLRTLRHGYEVGIAQALRTRPRLYFRFGAMRERVDLRVWQQDEDDFEEALRQRDPGPPQGPGRSP